MKRKEIDIFGVLVGLIVGCILGFFLSTRINIEMPPNNTEEVIGQLGNVYLLQIDKTTSPITAEDIFKGIKSKNLFAVVVLDGNSYYIYGGIANSESELEATKDKFIEKGYNPIVKREYILDKPNVVIEDKPKYDFYSECVNNLVRSLKNERLEISAETKANPKNIELFSAILALDNIENEKLIREVRLSIYEMIIESLQ